MGIYGFALAVVTIFRLVPGFGMRPIVVREVTQGASDARRAIPDLLYTRVGLALVAYGLLAAYVLAAGLGGEHTTAALIGGLLLFLLALDSFQVLLEIRLELGWAGIGAALEGVVALAGAGLGVLLDRGVAWFVGVYVVSNSAGFALVALRARKATRFDFRRRPEQWRRLVRVAWPFAFASLCTVLYTRIDVPLLAMLKTDADVGQYSVAYRFLDAFLLFPPLAMSVLTPVLSSAYRHDHPALRRRYSRAVYAICCLAVPVSIAGAALAPALLPDLPGFGRYAGAGEALAILAPAATIIFVGNLVQSMLITADLRRPLVVISAAGLVANVVLNLLLIPAWSYNGAAAATTATEALVVGCSIAVAHRRIHLGFGGPPWWALAATCALALAALELSEPAGPWAQLLAGVVAYVAIGLRLGALPGDELGSMVRARTAR